MRVRFRRLAGRAICIGRAASFTAGAPGRVLGLPACIACKGFALAAISLLFAFPTASLAGERGEFEFFNSCAQCHGADGQGGGPVAKYLVNETPPLTALSLNNGGVFPVDYVIGVLEGTADIGVHGREMPVWGVRYREKLMEEVSNMGQAESEALVRVRTLSLIDYLASIQAE